jgi:hypothetical protein
MRDEPALHPGESRVGAVAPGRAAALVTNRRSTPASGLGAEAARVTRLVTNLRSTPGESGVGALKQRAGRFGDNSRPPFP